MNHFLLFVDLLYVTFYVRIMKYITTQVFSLTASFSNNYLIEIKGRKLRQEVGLYGIFTIGLPANIIGSFVKSYSTNITMEVQNA